MWCIEALRIVFHENVPKEVLKRSCSWFLSVFEGLSCLKSNFRIHAKLSIAFHLHSLLEILRLNKYRFYPCKRRCNRAEKCFSIHEAGGLCGLKSNFRKHA